MLLSQDFSTSNEHIWFAFREVYAKLLVKERTLRPPEPIGAMEAKHMTALTRGKSVTHQIGVEGRRDSSLYWTSFCVSQMSLFFP